MFLIIILLFEKCFFFFLKGHNIAHKYWNEGNCFLKMPTEKRLKGSKPKCPQRSLSSGEITTISCFPNILY